jgi:arylsulfatase A-like enzyme
VRSRPLIPIVAVAVALMLVGYYFVRKEPPLPSFRAQVCGLPGDYLELIKRGYHPDRNGHVLILPRRPAYFGTGPAGWTHSGPWPYLQRIPLVFYGPGLIPQKGNVSTPATLADIAPTLATLLHGSIQTEDGRSLDEVARLTGRSIQRERPRLIVVVVWDGGGWNALEQWPGDWPNLIRVAEGGVSYTRATVGSSPSVTPAVHTTIGTGAFPDDHGLTGIPVLDEERKVVDSFLEGESSRFIQIPTFAERWDENNDNRAKVAMVGYEPWHLGMIGQGAERPGGDKDAAVWLDIKTNEWKTNPEHYELPESIESTPGFEDDVAAVDAKDGAVDGAWLDNEILEDPERLEETPAFIRYHSRALMRMIEEDGYGEDAITDLVFTNYKQIDRVGHYFNMESEEVHDSIIETDEQLGELVDFLESEIGHGRYALVVTADHGQQPDGRDIGGFTINPREIKNDINAEFGTIVQAVWPTEVFLDDAALAEKDVSVAEVARFLGRYTVGDNIGGDERPTGRFEQSDRPLAMAVPATSLIEETCG